MKAASTASVSSRRSGSSGPFVLGRSAFARMAAVERIAPSPQLVADLERLDGAAPELRRAVLTAKYGYGSPMRPAGDENASSRDRNLDVLYLSDDEST